MLTSILILLGFMWIPIEGDRRGSRGPTGPEKCVGVVCYDVCHSCRFGPCVYDTSQPACANGSLPTQAICTGVSCETCFTCRNGTCVYDPSQPSCAGKPKDPCNNVTCASCESCLSGRCVYNWFKSGCDESHDTLNENAGILLTISSSSRNEGINQWIFALSCFIFVILQSKT